ncbi:MAG: DUF2382 domain-containing protein [Chloroflexi bacterium]|nr:DUF2382 domain-containing protein [Chloroflexota bacterium]
MTRPESQAPDRPFAGAHSAVPGTHSLPTTGADSSAGGRTTLPLEAAPSTAGRGWAIRLAVRAEHITVSKEVVVRERVVVRRRAVADVARVVADVGREELRTSTEGEIDVVDTQAERTER